MAGRILCVLLLILAFAPGAPALPKQDKAAKRAAKQAERAMRKDPAFRAGYDDGYRKGANDSQYNSSSYNDEGGPVYDQAVDGYTPQYGDKTKYQKLFRLGYIAGYKDGWDFNAGRYPVFGAPDTD